MRGVAGSSLLSLLLLAGCGPAPEIPVGGPTAEWPVYGGAPGGARYSPLTQIDQENVSHLEVAWTYHTGDVSEGGPGAPARNRSSFQATPIVVDGTLYFPTAFSRVIALDPETGRERWSFDPKLDLSASYAEIAARGVTSWLDPERGAGDECRQRIFLAHRGARLHALDAETGRPCPDFGTAGEVDLTLGVARVRDPDYRRARYGVTSPPVTIGDLVVVGSAIGDNQWVEEATGIVRAYDARSGALRWAWDPIPREEGDPAWREWTPEARRKSGGANAWSILSVDPERDLVFVPTGSASPDFYGGERTGDNRWANSVVALRGSTGELVWGYQLVHHDLWDYDVPAQPTLVTLRRNGEEIPAVAQASKMGLVFILHRETGEPLFPVEERPVPQSDVPGEQTSPTQPFPTLPPPLVPHRFAPEDAWGLTPWDRGRCRELFQGLRYDGIFTPPSLQGTLLFPGGAGGTNWGSVAFEPSSGLLVLNTSSVPHSVRLIPQADLAETRRTNPGKEVSPQTGTPYGMIRDVVISPLGVPCNPPPWGQLHAIDLSTGEIRWQVTLGTTRDLAPVPIPIGWGTPNMGGPIITATGLVFIGAAMDDYLRAFDLESGAELWKGRLPAGGQATPMTYRLGEDRRQYVVIAAGGHGKMGTRLGDTLVAFALP
jgi:quinoprotein glucose dehydrogenase